MISTDEGRSSTNSEEPASVCRRSALLEQGLHCVLYNRKLTVHVPSRPLRGRKGRFGTLSQLLECGIFERTAVRHAVTSSCFTSGSLDESRSIGSYSKVCAAKSLPVHARMDQSTRRVVTGQLTAAAPPPSALIESPPLTRIRMHHSHATNSFLSTATAASQSVGHAGPLPVVLHSRPSRPVALPGTSNRPTSPSPARGTRAPPPSGDTLTALSPHALVAGRSCRHHTSRFRYGRLCRHGTFSFGAAGVVAVASAVGYPRAPWRVGLGPPVAALGAVVLVAPVRSG